MVTPCEPAGNIVEKPINSGSFERPSLFAAYYSLRSLGLTLSAAIKVHLKRAKIEQQRATVTHWLENISLTCNWRLSVSIS